MVLDCGRGAEAPRFHTKSSLAQARCSTWKAPPKLEYPTHHRGEIAADWVCGSGLRYLRKRTKVLSEAD